MSADLVGIKLTAPSTVAVGESFSAGLKLLTRPYYVGSACYTRIPSLAGRYNESPRGIRFMDNVVPAFTGMLEIDGGEGYEGPSALRFCEGDRCYSADGRAIRRVQGLGYSRPGVKYIKVKDPRTGVEGTSNPIEVCQDVAPLKLYWGDVHCQTFFSDGLRCPEELYAFARHEAFLDIFAVSDHTESLTDRQWDYFSAVANDCYEPGAFVTFQGLEWTSMEWGHRNVYYPGNKGPCLRATDPIYGQLQALYDAARRHGALVIPHHSANAQMGVDWSKGYDPEVERLVEVYSVWGNSERPEQAGNARPIAVLGGEVAGQHVIDALNLGRPYGLIAGGDIHDGRPGDDLHALQERPDIYRNLYRQGIMGVWAKALTREDVFDALWNRRVYATTNVRVVLRFSVNGHPMGSEVRADGGLQVLIEVASECPLRRIDLVCRGTDAECITPCQREVNWRTTIRKPVRDGYYYVRVTREDGEMAWSSPIWVKAGGGV